MERESVLDGGPVVAFDIAFNAVDGDGRKVSVGWSPETHELFTYEFPGGKPYVNPISVLGRVDSLADARELVTKASVPLPEGAGAISIVMLEAYFESGR